MIAIEQIKQLVKNRAVPKIVALAGSEKALMDDALHLIRAHAAEFDQSQMNGQRFRASEDALNKVVASLKTVPFLAEQKLIELHDAEKINATDAKVLLDYLNDPAPFSCFVIVFNKVDKRNKLLSVLEEKKYLYLFDPLSEKESLNFIRQQGKELGISIDQEAAHFLYLSLDGDMLALRSALEKLSLIYEKSTPSLEEIAEQIMGEGALDVFLLARIISEGQLKKALIELNRLRDKQENALKFLGVLQWQFRVLLHIRDCLDRGVQEWDIRKEVGVFGDRFNWMLQLAKKRSFSFHFNRLSRLLQCDTFLKSQKTSDPFSIIEKVVYQSTLV